MASLAFAVRHWSNTTSAKITVFSFSGTTPTCTMSGGTPSVGSRVSIGTDGVGTTDSSATAPVVMYSWVISISGLSAGTYYTWSITQGSNTRTGQTNTRRSSSPVSLIFVNCDGTDLAGSDSGAYPSIKALAQSEFIDALVHVDDHGYVDRLMAPNSDGNTRWTTAEARTSGLEYSYAVGYATYLGLTESCVTPTGASPTRYHDPDRIWCHSNMPMIVGPGDHELYNNAEAVSLSATQIANAKSAYLKVIAAGQSLINSTNSAAVVEHIGPVELIIPDRVFALQPLLPIWTVATQTNSGGISAHNPPTVSGRWLGSAQISDILGQLDLTSPFKIVASSVGQRNMLTKAVRLAYVTAGYDEESNGAQEPLHDYTVDSSGASEWTELYTDKVTGGIATKKTSTYNPHIFVMHTDTHIPQVRYFYQPETTTQAKLSLWEFTNGSVNSNNPHALYREAFPPNSYNGGVMAFVMPGQNTKQNNAPSDTTSQRYSSFGMVRVTGTSGSRKAQVSLYVGNDQTYSYEFVENKADFNNPFRKGNS